MKLRMFLYHAVCNRMRDLMNEAKKQYQPKNDYHTDSHKLVHGLINGTVKFKTKQELKELLVTNKTCYINPADLIQNADSYVEVMNKIWHEECAKARPIEEKIEVIYETYKDKLIAINDTEVEELLTKFADELIGV